MSYRIAYEKTFGVSLDIAVLGSDLSLKGGRPKVLLFNYGTKAYYLFLMRLGTSIAHVLCYEFHYDPSCQNVYQDEDDQGKYFREYFLNDFIGCTGSD